jgi:hypothetical protein
MEGAMSSDEEKPLHPALRALLVLVGVAFVLWALAPIVAEFVGAYR